MSNRTDDTDNTTRTNTDNDVNPPSTEVVNNSEKKGAQGKKKQGAQVIHRIGSETSEPSKGTLGAASDFVPTGTNSNPVEGERHPLDLLNEARRAAIEFADMESKEKDQKDTYKGRKIFEGRRVVKLLLKFVEGLNIHLGSLEDGVVEKFFDDNSIGKKHGGTKNKWYRLSDHCSISGVSLGLVNKRANALRIIIERGISSEDLDAKFDEPEPVGANGADKTGLEKYVLLHDKQYGERKKPRAKEPPKIDYETLEPVPLLEEMNSIVLAMQRHTILPDKFLGELKAMLEDKLRELRNT